jgi:hypothetical protein
MVHNIQAIIGCLNERGIINSVNIEENEIFTKHQLGEYTVEIRAVLSGDFPCSLPTFNLVDRLKYGSLAHVAWGDNGYADICYGKESFSADIHNPEIVFLASLEKVIEILDKSLMINHIIIMNL